MIVERIRELCDEQKMSIAELERKLNLANSSIRKWEAGNPGIDKVERVADFFDVSTDYLLGKTDIRKYSNDGFDEKTRSLARDFQELDEESQDLLHTLIKSMNKRGRDAKRD